MTTLGLLTFPAQIDSADPAGLTDGNASSLSLDQTARVRVQLGTTIVSVTPGVQASSAAATARAVAPGAGAAVVTIAAGSLPVGLYDIQVFAGFDVGAPVAADIDNMEFRVAATVVSSLQVFAIINVYGPVRVFRANLSGAQAISVNATAAGTAGVGYNAELIATRIA